MLNSTRTREESKKFHVNTIPGLKEYLSEFTSEQALSTTGYFFDMGIIPMPLTER